MPNLLRPNSGDIMVRISWREAIKRFTHIDARFVGCEIGLPRHDGFFTVEFYPWWEHPQYLEAREEGKTWGVQAGAEGFSEVTVYPKGVIKFQISRQDDVIDWDFTQEHPLLWQYEEQGTITCNQPLTLEQWMQIAALAKSRLTGYNRKADVAGYAIQQVSWFGYTASFSLGHFPYTLFHVLRPVLDEQDIRCFVPFSPKPPEASERPVLFLRDDDDYIIADDFEIDVPEFVHKPEWFQPR